MPGPGWRRLDVAELAPVDGLEAALLAVVRGEIHGATLQRVADLLGGRAAEEPGDPIAQTLVELFADVKRRLLETVTVQALREQLGRGRADHDDPKPGDCAGPGSSGPSR